MSGRDPAVDDKLNRLLAGGDLSPGEKDHLLDGVLARVAAGDAEEALAEQDQRAQRWWLKMLPIGALMGAAAAALLILPVIDDDDALVARGGDEAGAALSASCGDAVFSGGDQGIGALACARGREIKIALGANKASAQGAAADYIVAALLIPPSTLLWLSPDDAGQTWRSDGSEASAARAFALPADLPLGDGRIYLWRFSSPTGREVVRPYLAAEAERAQGAPPTARSLAGGQSPATIAVRLEAPAAGSVTDGGQDQP